MMCHVKSLQFNLLDGVGFGFRYLSVNVDDKSIVIFVIERLFYC
jgi:hypothetical protein